MATKPAAKKAAPKKAMPAKAIATPVVKKVVPVASVAPIVTEFGPETLQVIREATSVVGHLVAAFKEYCSTLGGFTKSLAEAVEKQGSNPIVINIPEGLVAPGEDGTVAAAAKPRTRASRAKVIEEKAPEVVEPIQFTPPPGAIEFPPMQFGPQPPQPVSPIAFPIMGPQPPQPLTQADIHATNAQYTPPGVVQYPPPPAAPSVTLEQIAALVSNKARTHEAGIVNILNSMGVQNVAALQKAQWDQFYYYVNQLI